MENNYKEVYFDKYCSKCTYEKTDSGEEPCNECLAYFVNINSHKPVNFKEKENASKKM